MARPKVDGFADIAQPELSPNEVARAMTGDPQEIIGPVALPEEALAANVPVVPVPHQHPMQSVSARRPIAEIVDQFLVDIQDHPDAHLLTTTLAGPADESEAQTFPDAPVRSLRIDAIRLIRRTSTQIISSVPKQRKAWQQEVMDGMHATWAEQKEALIASGRRGHVGEPVGR